MNRDISPYPSLGYTGLGYLVVRVSTASSALPLKNARVIVRGGEEEFSGVIASLLTDRDGLTAKIGLSAPPRILSREAGHQTPYAVYNITITLGGFYDFTAQSVPIFDTITSIQEADLIPLSESGGSDPYNNFGTTIVRGQDMQL